MIPKEKFEKLGYIDGWGDAFTIYRNRKSKVSLGMSYTHGKQVKKMRGKRGKNEINRDDSTNSALLRLYVHGTTDKLAGGIRTIVTKQMGSPCPCCGSKSGAKLRLTDTGRKRLERLRAKKRKV